MKAIWFKEKKFNETTISRRALIFRFFPYNWKSLKWEYTHNTEGCIDIRIHVLGLEIHWGTWYQNIANKFLKENKNN